MIHHVAVPPLHTGGRIGVGDHGLHIAPGNQFPVAIPFCLRPGVRLGGAGDGGLHSDLLITLPQSQHRLTEIEVAALGHAAEKMPVPLLIGQQHRIGDPLLQSDAARVSLVVAPWQLCRSVPGKAAGFLSGRHLLTSSSVSLPL